MSGEACTRRGGFFGDDAPRPDPAESRLVTGGTPARSSVIRLASVRQSCAPRAVHRFVNRVSYGRLSADPTVPHSVHDGRQPHHPGAVNPAALPKGVRPAEAHQLGTSSRIDGAH